MAPAIGGSRGNTGTQAFWQHVEDFRRMLLWSVVGWGLSAALAWNWWPLLWRVLAHPLTSLPHPPKVVVTNPTATVTVSFQLALLAGSLLAAPWILWQIWRFVVPAMLPRERQVVRWALLWTTLLFVLGAAAGYWTILPMTLRWLVEYGDGMFEQLWNVGDYTSMTVKLLAGCGAMFEFPLLTWILGSLGVVTSRQLLSWSRGAIVAIFVIAAILTPPDPVSQCLMAAPMLVLWFLGIGTAHLAAAHRAGGA